MSMEDYFAEAVDRLQAGETIEQILADYPDEVAQELHPLLLVVELAEQTAAQAPPQRLPLNRLAARVAFAQRAAELRSEMEAARARAIPSPQREAAPSASLFSHLEAWRRRITRTWPLSAPLMRLAPLTLLLVVVYLLTSVVVAVAQEALPGEPAYPVKLWILEQQVATAPEEQRAAARWMADRRQSEDVARLAGRLQTDPNAPPVTAITIQQFRGFDGEQLLIGDLKVIPWHQPPGTDAWLPLEIDGVLEPGAVVMLRYRVIPGAPNVVQGIALRVLQAPPVPTPEPTPTPAANLVCRRIQPPNWVEYIVRPGDTLSHIAARAQTSVAELRRVNCLTDGLLRAGMTILVPIRIVGQAPTAPPPALMTALPTQMFTPTPAPATETPTPIETPTDVPTGEPTFAQPGAENETAEPTPTTPPEATATPDVINSPTETPLPTETSAPTETLPPTQTATPVETPMSLQTPTATLFPTETAPSAETTEPPAEVTAAASTETAAPETATPAPTIAVGDPTSTPTLAPPPTATLPAPSPTVETAASDEPTVEGGE
ncbi:MAG: LysM peptidoglycan-binding domain-containing protein [Caldilinea sp.]|nr:LysM peptidoglycan-binding domain-containing protein [Caldilinea sp.]MDW8441415.1 LysM peptidoglycan-binding domain-containing protein [Caldilineaceae bacterium]